MEEEIKKEPIEEPKKNHPWEDSQEKKEVKPSKPEENIKIKKATIWQIVSGVLFLLLLISIFTSGFGIMGGDKCQPIEPTGAVVKEAAPQPEAPTINMEDLIEDDSVKGDKDAPVTIVEWSDYECPFCARFYQQTYKQIVEEYIDTGKAKLIFRDFPLSFHTNAQKAAEAAECAGEQDKYYDMHDKLFEDGVTGGVTAFKQYAEEIGLDTAKFNECLDSGALASEVQRDMADGQKYGIRGTPGFIINGQVISGALPFENFKQIIEAELAK